MAFNINRRTVVIGLASMVATTDLALAQASYGIEMLNKHPEDKKKRMVFHPIIQVIEPGDTVTFLPTDKGHNSVSIEGMIPEGTKPWKSKINKEFSVTLTKPGFYGYLCLPHATVGMVGLIVVKGEGMMDNYETAKAVKHRGKGKKIFEEIWAQVEADGILEA